MKFLGLISLLIVIVLTIFTFNNNSNLTSKIDILETQLQAIPSNAIEKEISFDLIGAMGKLQYFANKLYYSLDAKNQELTKFYTHEIEETMEAVEEAQVYDDGVDVSKNMATYGLKGLENFEKFMEQNPDDFKNHYKNLINSCNACHVASEHAFIIITEPLSPVVSNQKFSE